MVKNALEACPEGRTVVLAWEPGIESVRFWVRNPGAMEPEVQRRVFGRSFSTKGAGRGLGTYSIKLFTERYLQGVAGFASSEAAGTTFFIRLPWAPESGLTPSPE
jgi:signal transduction histidine kinase